MLSIPSQEHESHIQVRVRLMQAVGMPAFLGDLHHTQSHTEVNEHSGNFRRRWKAVAAGIHGAHSDKNNFRHRGQPQRQGSVKGFVLFQFSTEINSLK